MTGVRYGSLHFDIVCPTEKSLLDLSILCDMGELRILIMKQPEVMQWMQKYSITEMKLTTKLENLEDSLKLLKKKKGE